MVRSLKAGVRWMVCAVACATACSLTPTDQLQAGDDEPSGSNTPPRASGGTKGKVDAGSPVGSVGGSAGSSSVPNWNESDAQAPDGDAGSQNAGSGGGNVGSGGGSGSGDAGAAGTDPGSGGDGSAGQSGCGTNCVKELRLSDALSTSRRGGTGGMPYTDSCPPHEVLIGVTGYIAPNGWIESASGVCGEVTLSGTSFTTVSISRTGSLPLRGGETGTTFSRTCPSGSVVVGFDGRSGFYIDQIVLFCARLVVTQNGASHDVTLGTRTTLTSVGGTSGTEFTSVACPEPQFARGTNGRSGDFLDAFALNCANPTVVDAP